MPQPRADTGAAIERLPSGKWRYRVWDSKVGARISKTFTAREGKGEPDEKRRKPGCAAGDAWGAEKRAQVDLGQDSAGKLPTAAVALRYVRDLQRMRRNATHVREVERVLADLAKAAPDLKADNFRTQALEWRSGLKARQRNDPRPGEDVGRIRRVERFELSPVTINRYMVHVRSLVQYAVDMGELLRNPLVRVEDLDEADKIKATFTLDEIRDLVALRDFRSPAWRWALLMAYTGTRSEEALHLRWQDVDLANRVVRVRRQPGVYDLKRDKERAIPMAAGLVGILQDFPRRPDIGPIVSDTHFRKDADGKYRARKLVDVFEAAGFKRGARTPHSFRHTYAALMVAAREDVLSICRALGHSDLKMTDHYSREAASYRKTIEAEGWAPGELRLGGEPASAPSQGPALGVGAADLPAVGGDGAG